MSKGDRTRNSILSHATELASQVGLSGLTIGSLAEELELSKSGLFAHFRSKEALQVQVLEHAGADFAERVVAPSLKEPRGEPRVRALFERWLAWGLDAGLPGGCVFVAAAIELDDQPGPARDCLVALQRQWFGVLSLSFKKGIEAGHFDRRSDPDQFAQDLYGIMLGCHHQFRLMQDPEAEARARRAFERLLDNSRTR